jgi:hypothetical protein
MRAMLHAIELLPLVMGYGARMRRLPAEDRARYMRALEHSSNRTLRQATKLIKGAAYLSYYGDDQIMRRIGYDADANVARGRRLRAAEGRP